MKKISLVALIFVLVSCNEMQQVLSSLPQDGVSNFDISNGLKAALNQGIDKQVKKLTSTDGFFRNELVKILLPQELQVVDEGLRKIGLSSLADEGLRLINRAAEDAVKEATPIFVDAISNMSFNDARNILMGTENTATSYLENTTKAALYQRFSPVVKNSFDKVGADKVWRDIISKYNSIPLVNKVNPDLNDYVTNQAMNGVFRMIEVEEKDIRSNLSSRGTDLLKRVFGLQDKK